METLGVVGVLVLLVCLALVALVFRRWLLARGRGTLDMSFRERHWRFGVARYDGDRLSWFATFSLSFRPRRSFARSGLKVLTRRVPHGRETLHVVHDSVILNCVTDGSMIELAVPAAALPGFLAWLEAASRTVPV